MPSLQKCWRRCWVVLHFFRCRSLPFDWLSARWRLGNCCSPASGLSLENSWAAGICSVFSSCGRRWRIWSEEQMWSTKPVLFCWRCRLDVGARDTVVPAQSVLVKNAPEIAEPSRKRGEKRRQHAPAAQGTIERRAVKSCQPQPGRAKSGSRAGVHHKQEFVRRPEQDCDHAERPGKHRKRSANGVQAQKNCGK